MPGSGEPPAKQPGRIIGRDSGLARLRGLVEPVLQAGQVLLVIGEAGMGKTVLLRDAADRAQSAGMRVLRVTGRESESNLAFAGLHQLLRPVLPNVAGLPGRQAQAGRNQLRDVIARADTPASEPQEAKAGHRFAFPSAKQARAGQHAPFRRAR